MKLLLKLKLNCLIPRIKKSGVVVPAGATFAGSDSTPVAGSDMTPVKGSN